MDSRFFGFPLSTPLPLNYYQDYPRKEYLQISLSAEFSTFESFADFPYNEAAKEVDFYEKKDCTKDSFLEELDDFNVKVMYKRLAVNSVTFMLMSRCGLDT